MNINPWFVFEVTATCSADCPFCYNPWKHVGETPAGDMPLRQIDRLLSRLKTQANPAGITLSGGEPLLRPDLPEIVGLCRRLDIPVCIQTNGILLDKPLLEKLLGAGANSFQVFLPAVDPELYHRMTGRDQIRNVRKSLVILGASHTVYTIVTIVTQQNPDIIRGVLEMGTAFGASGITMARCLSSGRALLEKESFQPDKNALELALNAAEEASRETGLPVRAVTSVEPCIFPHSKWPTIAFERCGCGESQWTIGPDGSLRACPASTEALGNLLEDDFMELAGSPEAASFRDSMKYSECGTCELKQSCGGGCRFSG